MWGFYAWRHRRIELLELRKRLKFAMARMKTPGGPIRRAKIQVWAGSLEHAKDNGANKGEGEIRGDNAQSADERTQGHSECSHSSRRARTERFKYQSVPGGKRQRHCPSRSTERAAGRHG
jgi:hypothetical protein